jgi:hypothetical protein
VVKRRRRRKTVERRVGDVHMILKKELGQYSRLHPPIISFFTISFLKLGDVPSEHAYSPYRLPSI